VVSYINRLDDNKNPRLFLALVDRLVNEPIKRNLHFIIAGGGPLEDEIIAQVQALSYAERIHVLGHRRDVPELLACSDLTVSVAAMEGFGLGVLEAMAAGVPPVCYAAGGIPELIPPTDTDALLAAVGDFEGLVGRIGKLLRLSEAERRKMSERLRKQAARYEMMDCIERLEEVYGRVIGQA
jgi:glycosyltransferase involved in cell wall biosynthesis